jgi:hypothetical protein
VLASALVALLLATSPVSEKFVRTPVCSLRGTHTTLEVVRLSCPDIPRRATSETFTIRSSGGANIYSMTLDGASWTCVGFDGGAHRYLIEKLFAMGPRLELEEVAYASEDGGAPVTSAFGEINVPHYFAVASLVSPLGRHLAFVGGRDGGVVDGLYVLDTQTDQIHRLADPPDAPPARDPDHELRWNGCCPGTYAQLDPSMLRFEDEDTLVVTYGKDAARARAKSRTTKRFTLWPWPRVEEAPTSTSAVRIK